MDMVAEGHNGTSRISRWHLSALGHIWNVLFQPPELESNQLSGLEIIAESLKTLLTHCSHFQHCCSILHQCSAKPTGQRALLSPQPPAPVPQGPREPHSSRCCPGTGAAVVLGAGG